MYIYIYRERERQIERDICIIEREIYTWASVCKEQVHDVSRQNRALESDIQGPGAYRVAEICVSLKMYNKTKVKPTNLNKYIQTYYIYIYIYICICVYIQCLLGAS